MNMGRAIAAKLPVLFVGALFGVPVYALDTTGTYYHFGVDKAGSGKYNQCMKLQGAGSKFRLGNECEDWLELHLKQDLAEMADGSNLGVYGTTTFWNVYGEGFRDRDLSIRQPELYTYVNGVKALNGGNIWVGRRFYRLNSVYISDFFYWNQSSDGAGVEKVKLGDLYYSFAFSRRDSIYQNYTFNRYDFNVDGLSTNPNGTVQFGVSYLDKSSGRRKSHNGVALTVQHKQKNFLGWGGTNTFAIQRGQGPGTAFGLTGNDSLGRSDVSYRVVDYFDWQTSPRWGGQAVAMVQKDTRELGGSQEWISIGARLSYGLTDTFKIVTELGRDQVRTDDGTRQLTKFTIAPTWSPRGAGWAARPEFRLFYTYGQWNQAAQDAADAYDAGSALSSTGAYGRTLHGSKVGFQVEHWW